MKKIIAATGFILILTCFYYPVFDDKKVSLGIIFLSLTVLAFSIAKLYSHNKNDYDSFEKEMDRLHEDDGIFQYTSNGFYFKQNNITEYVKWDEIAVVNRFTFPGVSYDRQSGLEVITDLKNYEFNNETTSGIIKLTNQLYNYLPGWEMNSPTVRINNFGLEKTKLYERKNL